MRNIIITGFMGTGKSEVGRALADRLGCPFIDMDEEIERENGRSIAEIFDQDGEGAFRRLETSLLERLSEQENLVIATGGGTLIDERNRELMARSGTIVCLTCSVDTILARLQDCSGNDQVNKRPLIATEDPRAELERLLSSRSAHYASIPWQVSTDGLSVEEVVNRILEITFMTTMPVSHPDGEYNVLIGNNLLDQAGGVLRMVGAQDTSRVAIVTNEVVEKIHARRVEASLAASGYDYFTCVIPDGEENKTLAMVSGLYERFLVERLDRQGTVVSLGGGVTGDIAGFAAASFMRGVRFVQVPTTLLAMVDASVGGKTGVNLPQGKNLVGAFHQPAAVVIDPSTLSTLPEKGIVSGTSEVIKHALISDPELFSNLESGAVGLDSWWGEDGKDRIARAVRVKIDVVERDPLERGERAVLNLGHTVGHALETLTGHSLHHGQAVAIGLAATVRISSQMGCAAEGIVDRVEDTLARFGLPVRFPPVDFDTLMGVIERDKKKRGKIMRWILIRDIGKAEIREDVPSGLVRSVLKSLEAR